MTSPHARGFTLLELMLVLVVMAVVASYVLPNLFRPDRASLDESARRMVRLLHLASEEAQLRGLPLRIHVRSDRYDFELAGDGGQWLLLNEAPFGAQTLPEGVSISEMKLAEGVQFYGGIAALDAAGTDQGSGQTEARSPDGKKPEKALLGSITLMPDGMLTLADLTLHAASGDALIELRPGPGGIRIVDRQP